MPKLLTQKKKKNPKPPCGRVIEYSVPHSPFQRLIEMNRKRHALSYLELAAVLKINKGTLWVWMHSKNGYPHPKSFKAHHIEILAKTLKITEKQIHESLDLSRRHYTESSAPLPPAYIDSFAGFITVLENDRRQYISKSYVLNLARNFYASAQASHKPS